MNLEKMKAKADMHYKEGGVPAAVVRALGYDEDIDKLVPQKAATPVDRRTSVGESGELINDPFEDLRPHAVVQEQCGSGHTDLNEQHLQALSSVVGMLGNEHQAGGDGEATDEVPQVSTLIVRTGNISRPVPAQVLRSGLSFLFQVWHRHARLW